MVSFSAVKEKGGTVAYLLFIALALLLFFSVARASLFSEVSEEKRVWFELSFLLLASMLAELIVLKVKQPVVMVLMLVGVVISPSTLAFVFPFFSSIFSWFSSLFGVVYALSVPHLVASEGFVRIFAQLGAILLLFKVGLHSETKEIFNFKTLAVGLLGVVLPFAGGFYYASLLGHSLNYALFLGAALTATSVGVTVAVLEELKLLSHGFAKVILGAAVVDDILALLVLSLVQNVPSSLSFEAFLPFAFVLATALVFLTGGILIGRRVVEKYFNSSSGKNLFLGVLVFVLLYAYVAEFIGLSAIVGAFIAGICLNYSKVTGKLFELFYSLEVFFTPVFFLSLGMLVDIKSLLENLFPVIAITVIAILTKFVACWFASRATGSSGRDSLRIGVGMIPRGEIALIIGLYGLTAITLTGESVLSSTEYSIIAAMAFLTTIIVPPVLKKITVSV